MQSLIGRETKATRVKDLNQAVAPNPLAKDELVEQEQQAVLAEESGSPQGDGREGEESTGSKLEAALDGSADGVLLPQASSHCRGQAKKRTARRALRLAYEQHPEEISSLIERLMYEHLHYCTPQSLQECLYRHCAWVDRSV